MSGQAKPARTSGRPFWDEALAKKDTMIQAQAEEIKYLKAQNETLNNAIAVLNQALARKALR